jgi:elongation factor P--beta-lysine ligase
MSNAATGLSLQELHASIDSVISRVPLVNALRNQFAWPTKVLIDTSLVAQAQVKDEFLAAIQE